LPAAGFNGGFWESFLELIRTPTSWLDWAGSHAAAQAVAEADSALLDAHNLKVDEITVALGIRCVASAASRTFGHVNRDPHRAGNGEEQIHPVQLCASFYRALDILRRRNSQTVQIQWCLDRLGEVLQGFSALGCFMTKVGLSGLWEHEQVQTWWWVLGVLENRPVDRSGM
jgi:hypothetical protein